MPARGVSIDGDPECVATVLPALRSTRALASTLRLRSSLRPEAVGSEDRRTDSATTLHASLAFHRALPPGWFRSRSRRGPCALCGFDGVSAAVIATCGKPAFGEDALTHRGLSGPAYCRSRRTGNCRGDSYRLALSNTAAPLRAADARRDLAWQERHCALSYRSFGGSAARGASPQSWTITRSMSWNDVCIHGRSHPAHGRL